jgi:3-dehydroquinate synthase
VEAVKVACIRNAEFFATIERSATALARFEGAAMRHLIRRCAELHVNHIVNGGDPFESGSARPLDFGHWAAHKLEQMSGFRLRHGEAVAIGLALDVLYSQHAGFLKSDRAQRVLGLLEALGFELFHADLLRANSGSLEVLNGLEEFREHLGGQLAITLLREIGKGFEVHEMNPDWVREALGELQARHQSRSRT